MAEEAKGLLTGLPLVEVLLEDELLDEEEELLELELLLDEEEELLDELEELLLDEELEEPLVDELEELLDEELELEVVELLPLIEPAEAVRVTRSSRAPSSRLTIRSVCEPAARLLKVAGVRVA